VFYTIYWSLGLEEQFYLILPFVVFFTNRKQLISIVWAVIAIQFFLDRPQVPPNALWYFRSDGLAWGVLIALVGTSSDADHLASALMHSIWSRFAVFLFAIIMLVGLPSTNLPMAMGLIAAVAAVLVYLASRDRDYFYTGRFVDPVIQWIGARSYALYLVHFPAFAITRWMLSPYSAWIADHKGQRTVIYAIVAAATMYVLAEANFRLIEMPLRKRGHRLAAELPLRQVVGSG
jgi:peptidoglycan/LPS O-acetylase OafA/YrhL